MAGDEEEGEEYNLTMPAGFGDGEGSRIAFQRNYLKDALSPFTTCNIELTTPQSPGKFTGDVEGLVIVLMPMFVQW